jgi:hypothetical protein
MILRNEVGRAPLRFQARRAQPGPREPRRPGRTWKVFLVALLRALSVATA